MELEPLVTRLVKLPYLPSSDRVVKVALDMAELKEGEVFADLGCGDGRVLITAAKRYGAYAVGFELNPNLVRLARREVRFAGVCGSVDIVEGDFFLADLSRFDVIYAYPSPSIVDMLSLKLAAECKKGCRVVVHDHLLPNLTPRKVVKLPTNALHVHTVALYVF